MISTTHTLAHSLRCCQQNTSIFLSFHVKLTFKNCFSSQWEEFWLLRRMKKKIIPLCNALELILLLTVYNSSSERHISQQGIYNNNNNSMREIEESLRTMRNRIFNAYIWKKLMKNEWWWEKRRERENNNDILMPANQSDLREKKINESKYYSEFEI